MQELIKKYENKGYNKLAHFPNEYVLMLRDKDMAKVRIYENGKVWEY